jgi:hypothetical protein
MKQMPTKYQLFLIDGKRIARDVGSLLLSKRVFLLQRNIEENYIKH